MMLHHIYQMKEMEMHYHHIYHIQYIHHYPKSVHANSGYNDMIIMICALTQPAAPKEPSFCWTEHCATTNVSFLSAIICGIDLGWRCQ